MESYVFKLSSGRPPFNDPKFGLVHSITVEKDDEGTILAFANNDRNTLMDWSFMKDFNGVMSHMSKFNNYFLHRKDIIEAHGKPKTKTECECGSGNPMRCQNHSPWCKLYLKGV